MGPGVAQECVETKDGLHIWEDHFLPEIVDPVTGEPLPDGQVGELVFTSLTKEAMPVLRYRTRDLTRLEPGTARPAFRRMGKITGRSDDMMIIRGVNVFPTQIEEQALAVDGLAPHFVCVLRRPARLDELRVRIEARPDVDAASYDRLAASARGRIKESVGVTVDGRGARARLARPQCRQDHADPRRARARRLSRTVGRTGSVDRVPQHEPAARLRSERRRLPGHADAGLGQRAHLAAATAPGAAARPRRSRSRR